MLVLATGDAVGEIHDSEDDGLVENYFYTQMVLPMSTFALAIGPWKVVEILPQKELKYICHFTSKTTKVYLSFYYRNPFWATFMAPFYWSHCMTLSF